MSNCNEKKYPYPDENIFFITGVDTDIDPINYSKTTPLIIVSRKVELALAEYEDLGRLHKAKPIGCLSLAQLRVLHAGLEACLTNPSTKELKGGLFGAMLGKRQPWLIASMNDKSEPAIVDFVIARSSTDVITHAKYLKRSSPAIYSLELFSEMISLCDEVKEGKAKDTVYAMDYDGGELEEHLDAVENRRTASEKIKCENFLDQLFEAQMKGLVK